MCVMLHVDCAFLTSDAANLTRGFESDPSRACPIPKIRCVARVDKLAKSALLKSAARMGTAGSIPAPGMSVTDVADLRDLSCRVGAGVPQRR